ncbi:AI-2E family transporter [Biostraticola tofi]|uniref:Putative PurR-regulated permease PerM n=1 Tax=Biostraticola tofi TaxID=466109 RepID=A0A4R3YRB1_9GAMM|nr:AI-2E family transporter [Biostraticola tofi]TCV95495.1 putative PurR-regulated permease PerM [Biostraticola tofi]
MSVSRPQIKAVTFALMALFIAIIIPLHLFPCFIAGFMAYELIYAMTPWFERHIGSGRGRWVVVTLIATFVVVGLTLLIVSLFSYLTSDIQKGIDLTAETNRIFTDLQSRIPDVFPAFLPESAEELKNQVFALVQSNLITIRNMGRSFLHGLVTILIGLIIGAIISLHKPSGKTTYFRQELMARVENLSTSFRNIVFAQIKISSVNTALTAIMILVIFPLMNIHLPLAKTLIVATFILGLLPIIGNLISNFLIVISALSVSLPIGGVMLVYLVLIHKLEYFLNAEIVGSRIQAKSWELLLAMLIFEAAFGLEGIIAAPIYYAYLKTELRGLGMI